MESVPSVDRGTAVYIENSSNDHENSIKLSVTEGR